MNLHSQVIAVGFGHCSLQWNHLFDCGRFHMTGLSLCIWLWTFNIRDKFHPLFTKCLCLNWMKLELVLTSSILTASETILLPVSLSFLPSTYTSLCVLDQLSVACTVVTRQSWSTTSFQNAVSTILKWMRNDCILKSRYFLLVFLLDLLCLLYIQLP